MKYLPLLIVLFLCLAVFSVSARQPRKAHTTTISVPPLASVDVRDPDKFLNDPKLSPYWKVEKSREGIFCARPGCRKGTLFTGTFRRSPG